MTLLLTRAKHLQGKHDQKAHGAGGGMPSWAQESKVIDGLTVYRGNRQLTRQKWTVGREEKVGDKKTMRPGGWERTPEKAVARHKKMRADAERRAAIDAKWKKGVALAKRGDTSPETIQRLGGEAMSKRGAQDLMKEMGIKPKQYKKQMAAIDYRINSAGYPVYNTADIVKMGAKILAVPSDKGGQLALFKAKRLKEAGATPTATWAHGPGGLFSMPGLGGAKPAKKKKKKKKREKARFEAASTHMGVSPIIRAHALNYGRTLKKGDVLKLETDPHITVKFGIPPDSVDDVKKVAAKFPPVQVTFGEIGLFITEKFDVLKIGVEGPGLRLLSAAIGAKFDTQDTHPLYVPHLTLAYLKPGQGRKYAKNGGNPLYGRRAVLDTLIFSDKDGNQTPIKLMGETLKNASSSLLSMGPAQVPSFPGAGPTLLIRAKHLQHDQSSHGRGGKKAPQYASNITKPRGTMGRRYEGADWAKNHTTIGGFDVYQGKYGKNDGKWAVPVKNPRSLRGKDPFQWEDTPEKALSAFRKAVGGKALKMLIRAKHLQHDQSSHGRGRSTGTQMGLFDKPKGKIKPRGPRKPEKDTKHARSFTKRNLDNIRGIEGYAKRKGWTGSANLFNKMLEKAEMEPEYAKGLEKWMSGKAGTVALRDLARPWGKYFGNSGHASNVDGLDSAQAWRSKTKALKMLIRAKHLQHDQSSHGKGRQMGLFGATPSGRPASAKKREAYRKQLAAVTESHAVEAGLKAKTNVLKNRESYLSRYGPKGKPLPGAIDKKAIRQEVKAAVDNKGGGAKFSNLEVRQMAKNLVGRSETARTIHSLFNKPTGSFLNPRQITDQLTRYVAEFLDVPGQQAKPQQLGLFGMKAASGGEFTVFKDKTGRYRWFSISSNAFRDRDGEIVSLKALVADVVRADATGEYGPLRFWHMPGVDIGQCDFNMIHGRMLIESGTFKSEKIALKVAKKAKDYQLSIGFKHPSDNPDQNGVFHKIKRFERSLVPAGRAANPFTLLSVKEKTEMSNSEKIATLKALLGR